MNFELLITQLQIILIQAKKYNNIREMGSVTQYLLYVTI